MLRRADGMLRYRAAQEHQRLTAFRRQRSAPERHQASVPGAAHRQTCSAASASPDAAAITDHKPDHRFMGLHFRRAGSASGRAHGAALAVLSSAETLAADPGPRGNTVPDFSKTSHPRPVALDGSLHFELDPRSVKSVRVRRSGDGAPRRDARRRPRGRGRCPGRRGASCVGGVRG
jgi:hypothetical protein